MGVPVFCNAWWVCAKNSPPPYIWHKSVPFLSGPDFLRRTRTQRLLSENQPSVATAGGATQQNPYSSDRGRWQADQRRRCATGSRTTICGLTMDSVNNSKNEQ